MAHTNPNNPTAGKAPAPYDPFHGTGLVPGRHGPAEVRPEHHEHTDVPVRPLKLFFVTIVIVGLLVHVGLYVLFNVYDQAEVERDDKERQRSALPRTREEKLPSEPRIQGVPSLHANTPRQDTDEMRRENDRLLTTYGMTPDGKFARVPVSRAMEMALQQQTFKKTANSNSQSPTTRPMTNNPSTNAQQR